MKYAIVGKRDFSDFPLIWFVLENDFDIFNPKHQIVTGCAQGVDKIARIISWIKYFANGTNKFFYCADWDKHGKAAGPIRNKQIVDECDQVIAFWCGKSRGTKSTINLAYEQHKPVHIYWV